MLVPIVQPILEPPVRPTLGKGGGYTFTNAEAEAFVSRLTPKTDAEKALIDRVFTALNQIGLSKFDGFILDVDGETDSAKNWIADQYNLTVGGAPVYTAGKGWSFNGTSDWLETGCNPSTAGGAYNGSATPSCHMGFATNERAKQVRAGNDNARIGTNVSPFGIYSRANDTTTTTGAHEFVGHVTWSRSSSTGYERTLDGVDAGDVTASSVGAANQTFALGKAGSLYGAGRIVCFHWGSYLTKAEVVILQSAVSEYLDETDGWYSDIGVNDQTINGRSYFVESAHQPWNIARAANRPRHRFETRPGDLWSGDTQEDRYRSELHAYTKEAVTGEVWVSYNVMVTTNDGEPVRARHLTIGQYHASADSGEFGGYPPFEFSLEEDGLHVFTASQSNPVNANNYPRADRGTVPFNLGEFHDIVARIVFDYSGGAVLQVWLDGVQVLDLSGISIGMNDAIGPYWKFGNYWDPITETQVPVVVYANMEVGTTDLSDRILNPLTP